MARQGTYASTFMWQGRRIYVYGNSPTEAKIKGLTDRFKTLDKEIDYLKARVGASLGYEKFETDEVKVTFRKSESVVIPDESKVPAEFMEYKSTASPRKDDIKKYLKNIEGSDETCDWASIETKQNMQLK